MKKGSIALFFASLFVLGGCSSGNIESNNFSQTENTNQLGDFNLLSPIEGESYVETPTFTWEASNNATSYTLEVASTEEFIDILETEVYVKKANISTTSFTIQADLSKKNQTYFWRVTAVNNKYSKVCSEIKSFYLAANDKDEVPFDIGEADDWAIHQLGSQPNISIDNSNFFGNNKPSLVISFEKEKTNQGIVSSDGWMVLTRTVEKDLYGPDSLYLNFYYSGNDANLIIRLVDKDNEYWYTQVQISNNAKQGIILKFSDFVQRTADVTVANREFNFERIKYFEVVFERSFGDGVCLINDVKGVKFANYENLFIGDLRFNSFTQEDVTFENYNFDIALEEKELKLGYYKDANANNDRGINGYGFAKLTTNRYFMAGDAISMEVKYTGTKGSNALLRIYEQDTDRWSFKIPFNSMVENEYLKVVIPYEAFAKSSINGDGARQFYYILNMQFGLEGIYGTGTLSFKNFSIVKKADVVDTSTTVIGSDGIIDNFDNYATNAELTYKWVTSITNKDEMMNIEATDKPAVAGNKLALSMAYKSDMGPATYTLPIDAKGLTYNAITFSIKDKSFKSTDERYSHLKNANAEFAIVLTLKSGEEYRYHIDSIDEFWYEYTVPFTSFVLENTDIANPYPISCGDIGYVTLGMQYFYKDRTGKNVPAYTTDNVVLADNIKFSNATTLSKTLINKIIEPSKTDPNIAVIDDFEYDSATLANNWINANDQTYGTPTLSNDVSSSGGNSSMKFTYVGNQASPKIVTETTISSACKGKSLVFDLKGDDKATVYVNIYLTSGANSYQYRATLTKVNSSWNRYAIGFDNFSLVSGSSGMVLSQSNLIYVSKVTFGAVNYVDSLESAIYLDNLTFSANSGYTANTVTAL
ncbi:MAG: hypothetical protein MJ248_06640 [Bacilli bacterium]|nr:hypothetical protein [Bacilli bacterium]